MQASNVDTSGVHWGRVLRLRKVRTEWEYYQNYSKEVLKLLRFLCVPPSFQNTYASNPK